MDLDDLLGIDRADPVQQLADDLVQEDDRLLAELVSLRRNTMTQREVADRLGISRPAVAAFERYDADPRLSTVRRYALAVRAHVAHTVTPAEQRRESVYDRVLTRVRHDRSGHMSGRIVVDDPLAASRPSKVVVVVGYGAFKGADFKGAWVNDLRSFKRNVLIKKERASAQS